MVSTHDHAKESSSKNEMYGLVRPKNFDSKNVIRYRKSMQTVIPGKNVLPVFEKLKDKLGETSKEGFPARAKNDLITLGREHLADQSSAGKVRCFASDHPWPPLQGQICLVVTVFLGPHTFIEGRTVRLEHHPGAN